MVRASDLDTLGITRATLNRLVETGQVERISRGVYKLADTLGDETESLAIVARRVPQAVFCLLSALQFHELTTQLPREVWIALQRGSHSPRLSWPPLRMTQMSGDSFVSGIETHERSGVLLRVYSAAKTVADCFKFRHIIGKDVALEALKDALHTGKANPDDIWQHARQCRVSSVMRPYLETLLHE